MLRKRALSIVLAFLLFLGATGCSNNYGETSSSQTHFSSSVDLQAVTEPGYISEPPLESTDAVTTEIQATDGDIETDTEPAIESLHETDHIPVKTDDSTFDIYFLDVGQGDAACVICDGEAMLIDGGNRTKSSLIYSFLQAHSISHLAYIVATHPDADHVGGLAGALNYASVGKAFCTVMDYDTEPFQNFVRYLEQRNCGITIPKPGEKFYLGCALVTILYPEPGIARTDNTSIALRIEYGDTSFFFTGDCETEDEESILSSGLNLQSTVLKVAHHGSKHSTSSNLLNAVQPTYAVISVGGDNTYGHPTEEVLSNLKSYGAILYRTDINGDIHCTSDGSTVSFDVKRNADIDCYIAAGGYKNYLEQLAAQETEQPSDRTLPGDEETEPSQETEPRVTYIANTNTHKFHYPGCSSVDSMKESNKWYFTGSRDELIDLGYDPCKRCNP